MELVVAFFIEGAEEATHALLMASRHQYLTEGVNCAGLNLVRKAKSCEAEGSCGSLSRSLS
jgi:hypothetical protein